MELLQFNGSPTNDEAGVVQGYNSHVAAPPLDRTELYELWWAPGDSLTKSSWCVSETPVQLTTSIMSAGRYEHRSQSANIPSVSGLAYTPVFVNLHPAGRYSWILQLGAPESPLPGRAQFELLFFTYGVYDGNRATGEQIELARAHNSTATTSISGRRALPGR